MLMPETGRAILFSGVVFLQTIAPGRTAVNEFAR